jgi:hypothetical protein
MLAPIGHLFHEPATQAMPQSSIAPPWPFIYFGGEPSLEL